MSYSSAAVRVRITSWVIDALRHVWGEGADWWRRLFLKHHPSYLDGSMAPDDRFKDFNTTSCAWPKGNEAGQSRRGRRRTTGSSMRFGRRAEPLLHRPDSAVQDRAERGGRQGASGESPRAITNCRTFSKTISTATRRSDFRRRQNGWPTMCGIRRRDWFRNGKTFSRN
jgi:hypothetical protein